ncbi:Protein-glutamate methylesterase/protein-glutamine glutaminase [Pseudoalteromonas holothuriae]|uniref:Protein-glutamate methylesterase/protein-glutamine glutaminase n=1 Tax=Pseudoalteromonas holothuriae TaxID=2963714 RepID=A0A9W4QV40_9GAMM|nr:MULTISPECIES: chemotaxis response regulator protein-glutamate methylesterase [unclassified Pseudoalteromonas]CAH9054110.1 Protein-glutamate methylesterase/protein-glutamine glutaminase [Pseudoalteromonas sp. CIP111854]CAH9058656.1 Protein-glutamate methylesterase/protein-glutamine glutaminase [Pseudoalteromonas sp. CIP111951]
MIKVLIVDDSPLIRGILTEILNQASDIKVVGAAADPYQAREMIKSLHPDVLTLDIEMPKMDGISFLRNLMRLRPMPVVMISTLTQQGSPATIEALEIGAVDFIAKPVSNVVNQLKSYTQSVHEKVRIAASARVRSYKMLASQSSTAKIPNMYFKSGAVLAIGASTGGTEAIKEVLIRLPLNAPPVVVTQHIPPVFSTSFAQRMDKCCTVKVKEAAVGDELLAGHVFIAPGDKHLKVVKKGGKLVCELDDTEPVNRHKPAVDVLFDSLLPLGEAVCAALLTGMGSDGAKAMLRLLQAGAFTVAQDENTSVVWGMPRAAVELKAARSIVPLQEVTHALLTACKK